jgi:hypothetical protein
VGLSSQEEIMAQRNLVARVRSGAIAFGMVTICISGMSLAARPSGGQYELQARVQKLEDEEAIRNLLVEYGRLLDAHDLAAYSKLFAREGVWTGSFGTAKGPEEILAMLQKSMGGASPYDPNKVRSIHLMSNFSIHVDGDRATATSKWTNFARSEDNKLIPRLAGHYNDTLVKEDGHWKFLSREAPRDIPNPETAAEAGKTP